MHIPLLLDLALIVMLLAASVYDLRQRRVPNRLLLIGLLAALLLHLAGGNLSVLLTQYLAGFALGLVMFLPLYMLGGMAAGDVKLMATVGAFVGPALAFQCSLATYCAGGVMALGIVLARGAGRAALLNMGALLRPWMTRSASAPPPRAAAPASVGGMPYALAITAGTLTVLYIRHT